MTTQTHSQAHLGFDLATAVIVASINPVMILDNDLKIIAVSTSFCHAFWIDPADVSGQSIFAIGDGEWNEPRLRSLLTGTLTAGLKVDDYEMDLRSKQKGTRRLKLNANRLDYVDKENVRLLLSINDVTELRETEKIKNDLMRDKENLVREMQHRIANSLQIIASLIMNSARRVQSDETRGHLQAAHDRVISIAAVQQHLAASGNDTVKLRPYFTQLAQSISASMIEDPDRISIDVLVDETIVDDDTSVRLGLVVTELIINAIKHAFPSGRHGRIRIDYQSHGPDWTLSVDDNGVGMPSSGDRIEAGLGTSIIEAIAKQLNARITVADAHPGTKFSLNHSLMNLSDSDMNIIKLHDAGWFRMAKPEGLSNLLA
ncbi:sensor histidine kinase [Lichenifustis flavocetrariae]|uniref:histidine kinase n=1 Tax=Lichenifustis flavocetrariae TaxID=2949735 RepID=A0AA42CS80_9HYPH|nr:histidine kinase dimerization/phosphoacceptor domain -containing protein [Lichenifustis flavocetrariae]MCW6513220.1 ATP-binding protein [Lichenifustis flavocetrariae]